jgi:hypothetical protein
MIHITTLCDCYIVLTFKLCSLDMFVCVFKLCWIPKCYFVYKLCGFFNNIYWFLKKRTCNNFVTTNCLQHVIVALCFYCFPIVLVNDNIWHLIELCFNFILTIFLISSFCYVHQYTCKMWTHTLHVIDPSTPCGNKQFVTHLNILNIIIFTCNHTCGTCGLV